jgi:hypothetical protein
MTTLLLCLSITAANLPVIEATAGVHIVSDRIPVQVKSERSLLYKFEISNPGGFKEAWLSWLFEEVKETEKGVAESPRIWVLTAEGGAHKQSHFEAAHDTDPSLASGCAIPLKGKRTLVQIEAEGKTPKDLLFSLGINYRSSTLFVDELTPPVLSLFNSRFCLLQDNMGGIEQVYESEHVEGEAHRLFFFENLNELAFMLDRETRFTYFDEEKETVVPMEEYLRGIGGGLFTISMRVENLSTPTFQIEGATATIESHKRLWGRQPGIGKSFETLEEWKEKMSVELRNGRPVATSIRREVVPLPQEKQ